MGVTTACVSIPAQDRLDATTHAGGAAWGGGDERALIDRARTDPEAFACLYRRHHRSIAEMLYRRTGDAHAAEDLAAQTFINAWRGLGKYRHTGAPFRAWLMRIATNEAGRWMVNARRRGEVESDAVGGARVTGDPDLGAEVRAAVRALRVKHQDVLSLVYFESLSVERAALVLGVRPGTVKSRLSRAREALRVELDRRENRA